MKQTGMTAKTLRSILSVMVVGLIALSAVGFYFAQGWLIALAVSISHTVGDSRANGSNLQSLHQLQDELNARQDVIIKTNALIAPLRTYQSQAIQDLNTYASEAGITISNYSFQATATSTTQVISGSSLVTATLTSPTSFTKLLKFMNSVESNLPKMQISSVNLGRVSGGDSDSVRIDQLIIEVYTQ